MDEVVHVEDDEDDDWDSIIDAVSDSVNAKEKLDNESDDKKLIVDVCELKGAATCAMRESNRLYIHLRGMSSPFSFGASRKVDNKFETNNFNLSANTSVVVAVETRWVSMTKCT